MYFCSEFNITHLRRNQLALQNMPTLASVVFLIFKGVTNKVQIAPKISPFSLLSLSAGFMRCLVELITSLRRA